MFNSRLLLFSFTLLSLTVLVGCGGDDPAQPTPPTPRTTMPDGLEGYWQAQTDISSSLNQMNLIYDSIEAAFDSKAASNDEIDLLVDQFVSQANATADHYDSLIDYENAIKPYGTSKGMFSNAAKAVVVGVYNVSKKVVVSAGQQMRTGWNVLSGKKTLREALRDPDSGIPILSDMANRLKEHNDQRDNAIEQSITASDDQLGNVPFTELEGSTPAERVATYRNLPEDHQLKKQMRGDVHLWNVEEKTETVKTIKKVAQDQVKNYASAVGGSDELIEISEQMTNATQPPEDRGTMTSIIKDADTSSVVEATKTIIIYKRYQPEHEQKIAVLQGVAAEFRTPMPAGTYDIILMAEDYIRAAATEVVITAGEAQAAVLDLHQRITNSLVVESVTATPAVAAIDEVVTLSALAASTVGQNLTFSWTATGPSDVTIAGSGPAATFTSAVTGDYVVTMTVSDNLGNQKQKTVDVEVVGGSVEVTDIAVADGAFVDGKLNPGEQVIVTLTMSNPGNIAVTGNVTLAAMGPFTIVSAATQAVSIDAAGSMTWPVTISLPVDFNRAEASLKWTCTTAEWVIEQELDLPVDFWAIIDEVPGMVTERVITLNGRVANPLLTTAHLIVNSEVDQVFEVPLNAGEFSQTVVLEGAPGIRIISVTLVADSGTWRAEDIEAFRANIPLAGFRVTLTWDTDITDVDLWVTDPSGEKCYYQNKNTASGLALDVDDVNGHGPENITNVSPPAGDYLVQVHYYDDEDDEGANGSSCQIVIRTDEGTEDEAVRSYSGYLSETGDIWTVTTVSVGDKSSLQFSDDGSVKKFEGELPPK